MYQVNLNKVIQENSGFFNKIILPGQFSLKSVGDVCGKSAICCGQFGGYAFMFCFKSMHVSF